MMREGVEEQEIVIVGGGICGLATALALHRKGISSLVMERAEALRATGAAIGIQTNGWRALDQLGVGSKLRETSIPIRGLRDVSINNVTLQETPIGDGESRCLRRAVLLETLANELPVGTIKFGCRIVAVNLDPETSFPILQLHDGSVIKAKVVIGCDGVNSVIANFLKLHPTKLSSTINLRGFTNYPNGHGFSNEFVTMKKDHVLLGRIPMDEKLVYWFIARPGTPLGSTVSKDLKLIRELAVKSIKGFPLEMVDMIKSTDLDSLTLNGTRYRPPWNLLESSFRKGTVTVAGDAMHVMGPFLGQGGSAALEDAIVLARCLAQKMNMAGFKGSEDIGKALDQYVRERRMRLVKLSTKTCIISLLLETSSLLVKFISIVLMIIFFRDRFGHTRYDCGRL